MQNKRNRRKAAASRSSRARRSQEAEGPGRGGPEGGPAAARDARAAATPDCPLPPGDRPRPVPGVRLQEPAGCPALEKVVISMGLGRFAVVGGEGKAKIEQAEKELGVIAGQKPVRCKAKKSVANFKVREGMETASRSPCAASACTSSWTGWSPWRSPASRTSAAWTPLVSNKAGNYNFGFAEQTVFPGSEC